MRIAAFGPHTPARSPGSAGPRCTVIDSLRASRNRLSIVCWQVRARVRVTPLSQKDAYNGLHKFLHKNLDRNLCTLPPVVAPRFRCCCVAMDGKTGRCGEPQCTTPAERDSSAGGMNTHAAIERALEGA